MRNLLIAAFAFAPLAALAQSGPATATAPMSPVNCDTLNTTTMVCVRNAAPEPIIKITCSGFFGSTDLSISHGTIRPGETSIVDFYKGKCSNHIVVFTRGGHQYPFDGFDTTKNTQLLVDPN